MKKTEVLKRNYEIRNVLKKGKYYRGKQISIKLLKIERPINLLGIAVNKKAGNSVYRNRVKRIIKESYRLLEDNIKCGNSIVIVWNKQLANEEVKFNNIKKDMEDIFIKANILKGEEEK